MSASHSDFVQLLVNSQNNTVTVIICGDWIISKKLPTLTIITQQFANYQDIVEINFITKDLANWDSILITELIKLLDFAKQHNIKVNTQTLPTTVQRLLALVYATPERTDAKRRSINNHSLDKLLASIDHAVDHAKQILIFIGELSYSFFMALTGRTHFRPVDLWLYIQECGPSALPIVTLISLLVGLILAFVGALELSLFGAQIYIANLVSLGMTREMGALMTAIIMSGRTGAAYAAQLGTMQVNNEIDALKTMNFEPITFLVLPRMIALIFIMPLLCLYADLMGILGGGFVTTNFFDISITEYINRTVHAVHLKDFMVGFVKSSVFGTLIAISGCMRGMQSGRSASAVGEAATSAVVTSMVFIVVADSIMTIICNRLGI